MTAKKHSWINWVLWIIVLICVVDLVHMTYRKIVRDAQGTAPQVEQMVEPDVAFVNQEKALTFEGQQKVNAETIPWKVNCGVVEDEELGNCLFLTPNTALAFGCKPEAGQVLNFDAQIYPEVQSVSDGCSIRVQIFAASSEKLLADATLQIASSAQAQNCKVDLSDYAGQELWIRLACGNGAHDNDEGDWLFLTRCTLQ